MHRQEDKKGSIQTAVGADQLGYRQRHFARDEIPG